MRFNVYAHGRKPDPDNLLKYTLDAMKGAGLIVDDSAKWCDWEKPVVYPCHVDDEHTLISITDVDSAPTLPMLELRITARPMDDWVSDGVARASRPRDVYLCERDPRDQAARMAFLMHTDCPLATVSRIIAWAHMLSIPVIYDPPGNCDAGWTWPNHSPATIPTAYIPDPSLF